jgi:dTDP-glucose pyrophosphorylase
MLKAIVLAGGKGARLADVMQSVWAAIHHVINK